MLLCHCMLEISKEDLSGFLKVRVLFLLLGCNVFSCFFISGFLFIFCERKSWWVLSFLLLISFIQVKLFFFYKWGWSFGLCLWYLSFSSLAKKFYLIFYRWKCHVLCYCFIFYLIVINYISKNQREERREKGMLNYRIGEIN